MNYFEGKKAVVIGGSGGIGKAVALMLSKNGAEVVIHGRNPEKLLAAKKKIEDESGFPVQTVDYELNAETIFNLDKSILNNYITYADILCVCFGPFLQKNLEDMTAEEWKNISLLDYALPGMLVSKVLKPMMKNKWGRILLFGGTGTTFRSEFKTNAAYGGAKTGVGVLVQSVAANYASYGITCNGILPGFVETEYQGGRTGEVLAAKMPLGTLIKPESIASAAEYLLSNPDLNGVLLKMDRGWSPFN